MENGNKELNYHTYNVILLLFSAKVSFLFYCLITSGSVTIEKKKIQFTYFRFLINRRH